jgi:hypothetical protein
MSEIQGTNVAAAVVPFTTDDKYPTHVDKYGRGGWRGVGTYAELNLIPAERRVDGMAIFVRDTGLVYIYTQSTDTFDVFVNFKNFISTLIFLNWAELSGYAAANPGVTLTNGTAARIGAGRLAAYRQPGSSRRPGRCRRSRSLEDWCRHGSGSGRSGSRCDPDEAGQPEPPGASARERVPVRIRQSGERDGDHPRAGRWHVRGGSDGPAGEVGGNR